jgi:hypothetical protein
MAHKHTPTETGTQASDHFVDCSECAGIYIDGSVNAPVECPNCGKPVCYDCRDHENGWCLACSAKR